LDFYLGLQIGKIKFDEQIKRFVKRYSVQPVSFNLQIILIHRVFNSTRPTNEIK